MWFLNRKKVYQGYIIFEQDKISQILTANHIKYMCKVINKKQKRLKHYNPKIDIDRFIGNLKYEKKFYIYTTKKDYGRAKELLNKEMKKLSL